LAFFVLTFKMLSPFSFPLSHASSPASVRILPPTHSSPHHPGITLHWGIKPSQDQRLLLLLMPDNAILYYIHCWSHEALQVNSLVGGLVPGSSGESSWLILLFFLWVANPFSSFSSNSSIGVPLLSSMQAFSSVSVRLLSASTSWHQQ